MNKNNLGCGKKLKRIGGDTKETNTDKFEFICGVPNGWGTEIFCNNCMDKLRKKWIKEDDKQ